MGNRAVITTESKRVGVYLHWNGGRESVESFLTYCKLKGYRSPDQDIYGFARLCQVIGNFFGGGLSVGIGAYENLDRDNGDNGTYIIKGWNIVGRLYDEEPVGWTMDKVKLIEFMQAINEKMPTDEQIDVKKEYWKYEIIEQLNELAKAPDGDQEGVHIKADELLLELINDYEVKQAFERIKKWYA